MRLRTKLRLLGIILVLILSSLVLPKQIILFSAQQILHGSFLKSKVTIGECSFNLAREIILFDIQVSKGQVYNFRIKEANLSYTLRSLFKKIKPVLTLKDLEFNLNTPQRQCAEFTPLVRLKIPNWISNLELKDLNLALSSADLSLQGKVSLGLNASNTAVNYLDVEIKQLARGNLHLEELILDALQSERKGNLYIKEVRYNKFKMEEIKSQAVLEGAILSLDGLSSQLSSGKVLGEITLNLRSPFEYTSNLKFSGLSSEGLAEDFNLKEKIQLKGRLEGKAILRGEGLQVAVASANFLAPDPGGTLTINDADFLQNIAKNTQATADAVREGLQDYRYNNGEARIFLEEDSLTAEIILDGQQGKRNLKFSLNPS